MAAEKFDYKKEYKDLYLPKQKPMLIDVPAMSNKAIRALESLKFNFGEDKYSEIVNEIGSIDEGATADEQTQYMKAFINAVTSEYGRKCAAQTMRCCGHQCISKNIIETAKDQHENASSREEFLEKLNQIGIGGGHLHIENGNIIGVYDQCYCDIAKNAKNLPISYCECSAGWFEKLFSSVFNKKMNVTILHTILDGSNTCTFEIK